VAPDDIRELFCVFGPVEVRRMFGGAGIYAEGRMFALVSDGVIYLKADAHNAPAFEREQLAPLHLRDQDGAARGDVLSAHAGPPLRRPGRARDLGARGACGSCPRRSGKAAGEEPQATKLTRDVMPALMTNGEGGCFGVRP
jgi:TfoX-like protein